MPPRTAVGSWPGVAVSVLLCGVIVLADVAQGLERVHYVGLLVAVPFLAATFAPPTAVGVLGGLALVAGSVSGLLHEDGTGPAQWVRLACIAVATAMAAVASRSRLRRERRLVAVQSAADAASRAILRPLPPVLAGVPLGVHYLSAVETSRVGGDLYEAVETAYGLRLVIGDVRGKGLDAVRLAAVALGSFREAAHRDGDLGAVARAMHAAVSRDAEAEDFVTALLVEVGAEDDPCPIRMLSCGHPPPLLVRAGAARELRLPEQPPLGIAEPDGAVAVHVQPGDRVLLYTDGALEARRNGEFFGLRDAAAESLRDAPLPEALAELSLRLRTFTGTGPDDDVAFLAFELPNRPAVAPAPR